NIALILPRRKKNKKKHQPALPYAEIPAFMAELRKRESTAAKALEFVILTACRTDSIIGQRRRDERPPMMWKHVDLDARVWTIPGTKNDDEHTAPLPEAAMAVLRSVQGLDPVIVFPSPDRRGQPMSNGAMLRLIDRMNDARQK